MLNCILKHITDYSYIFLLVFFFQAEDGIRDGTVTGVQTCALPISDVEFGIRNSEFDIRPFTAADPVSLHFFERMAPLNRVRSEERRVGKECRYRWSQYH